MNEETICPCCLEYHFENVNFFETCPICGWQDDLVQRHEPDYRGGANKESLNQHRREWERKKKIKTA